MYILYNKRSILGVHVSIQYCHAKYRDTMLYQFLPPPLFITLFLSQQAPHFLSLWTIMYVFSVEMTQYRYIYQYRYKNFFI